MTLPPDAQTFTWPVGQRPPGDGPWRTEPDKVVWVDAATGLDAMAHRNEAFGHWCGYVGVPPAHPWHGRNRGDIPARVHGGVSYASACVEGPDPAHGVCHTPRPGREANVRWVGFDCGHSGDQSPTHLALFPPLFVTLMKGVYRDLPYVIDQVTGLAKQAQFAGDYPDAEPELLTLLAMLEWAGTAVTPRCPQCGQLPGLALDGQAFCSTEECDVVTWNPTLTRDENVALAQTLDLSGLDG